MKEFPIFGEESEQASLAALAAGKQGKYWEMHRALLEQPGRANKDKALKIARELKLDIAKLQADMALPEIRKVITDAQGLANSMGIQGTPHFLVGPKTIPGAPEDLLAQIQSRVAEVRKDGCTVC
jgi:protein-disulfide isomerase